MEKNGKKILSRLKSCFRCVATSRKIRRKKNRPKMEKKTFVSAEKNPTHNPGYEKEVRDLKHKKNSSYWAKYVYDPERRAYSQFQTNMSNKHIK